MKNAPSWLQDFQARFGNVLRTPLDQSRGTLESRLPYGWEKLGVLPRSTRSAAMNLGDYHRQYWFRLFSVLQNEFPLTSRLMGAWTFNQWATAYLRELPPRDWDLAKLRQHFVPFLTRAGLPQMLLQAAALDAVRADVFMAPAASPWEGLQGEADDPFGIRLVAAPDWRIHCEAWALVELCLRLPQLSPQEKLPEPPRVAGAWLIQRDGAGLVHRPLRLEQADLYALLSEKAMNEAIADWEETHANGDPACWQETIQNWVAQSVNWGLWSGSG